MPPAWEPRRLATPAEAFGRHWLEVEVWDETDPARAIVARLQHRIAQGVSEVTEGPVAYLEDVAAHVGETPDYLRSKLYGHRPASPLDWFQWAEVCGSKILRPLRDERWGDLLPSQPPRR